MRGAREGFFKNKMLKEGSKNRAGEGWKKSGSQLPTQTMHDYQGNH